MGNENGFEFTPKEDGIGMPVQENNYVHTISPEMVRGTCPEVFDNNGSVSKGMAGGTTDEFSYGPVTFGG